MVPQKTSHPLLKIFSNSLVVLPTPSSLSFLWNFGSLLGFVLTLQVMTGVFLAMHFSAEISFAFSSVDHLARDVTLGWLLRTVHANGASLFFIFLYLHLGRGLYYFSYKYKETWNIGVMILLAVMATAFLGYVLPWGQMSLWGATVITNLFSAIPVLGQDIVMWLWGGYSVDKATLGRFYAFHFALPFLVLAMVVPHLIFLHTTGSSNPMGANSNNDKIPFSPFFTSKDLYGAFLVGVCFLALVFSAPWYLGDPENFIEANPLVTPVHIQPEWYFLFAYAVLRAIPSKLGGVVALASAVMVFFVMPLSPSIQLANAYFHPISWSLFWWFAAIILGLTWIGARPVEDPFIVIGQILSFFYFIILYLFSFQWNS